VGCRAVSADVTREEDVAALFDEAMSAFGLITGVVNNAGVTASIGDLSDTPVDVVRRVVEVNLMGVLLCCRQAVPLMSSRRGGQGGAIVNVSSAAATTGAPHEYVHYAAAKAGVEALTIGLARESRMRVFGSTRWPRGRSRHKFMQTRATRTAPSE